MNIESAKIQEAAEILNDLLKKYGFEMSGAPLVDNSTIMASFDNETLRAEYSLKITKADDSKDYIRFGDTQIELSVKLYNNGQAAKELYPHKNCTTNASLMHAMEHLIDVIEPELKEYLKYSKL